MNYLIITDQGRLPPIRHTARAIRAYNPIQSKFSFGYTNQPIHSLIEDILEKDSVESYFIQICDFVFYIVHLYYKTHEMKGALPNRVGSTREHCTAGCPLVLSFFCQHKGREMLIIYQFATDNLLSSTDDAIYDAAPFPLRLAFQFFGYALCCGHPANKYPATLLFVI